MKKEFLFVYGKLRQGGALPMADHFAGSRSVGNATADGSLYDLGQYPSLVLDGSGSRVLGEVYEIDDETLKQLDAIEASAGYYRTQEKVTAGGRRLACWIYLPDPNVSVGGKLIGSGDWIAYKKGE
jgi:gamma-glutamylcyclotransferase (GGCT)/AIG2-like uncharacterized protein YtfP